MRVVILGAGFGGLELATTLSAVGGFDVVLIDKSDAFVFGYSKLDVMFGRTTLDAVRLPYSEIAKPGVRVLQETITAIDPAARRVTTDIGVHEADVLVVALGADYDLDATPGLAEGGNEFHYRRRAAARRASTLRSSICFQLLTCAFVPGKLDTLSSGEVLLVDGGKEVKLRYRVPFISNWPLGTRVNICA